MEVSTETDSELGQSEPWIMLEDSDIEVCDEPSKSKEAATKKSEVTEDQDVEEDDFAKLRRHRKLIEQLEAPETLSWDSSDITPPETTEMAEDSPTTKPVCTRCSICSVLLTKGASKITSYFCYTFLALCALAVASGLGYYFQFNHHIKKSNLKDVILRYTQPDYAAVRYDRYIEPKYEKDKKRFYYTDAIKYIDYQKYEDTSRKRQRKSKNAKYNGQKYKEMKRQYKKSDEKRYNKKDFDTKAYKQEYKQKRHRK